MALLTIEGVSKRFGGDAPAVRDFSLTIEAGRFLALLGPSGCGKTTLLRMIAGFARPDAGGIRLGERLLVGPENFTPPYGIGSSRKLGASWMSTVPMCSASTARIARPMSRVKTLDWRP